MVPSSAELWTRLAADVYNRWNLPNCIGAIDGKHIQIKAPTQGSEHFIYMGIQNIMLLALVDTNYIDSSVNSDTEPFCLFM